jgi:Uncharacterized conserved protein
MVGRFWKTIAALAWAGAAGAAEPGTDFAIERVEVAMVWIAPGTFTMGSPEDEWGRDKAEGIQRTVTLTKGFWIGRTEVTQAQYQAVAGTNPSRFTEVGADAPVERVSWLDAMAWCETLTARERAAGRLPEGYVYTLPTEAQWEYACRAGEKGAPVYLDELAWYDENSGGITHRVAQKKPNAWGLHDMLGNVLEWCRDWYGDYARTAETDPTGPERGYFRMARGGSWRMGAAVCRPAARAGGSSGRRDYTIGFRVGLCAVEGVAEKGTEPRGDGDAEEE